MVRYDVATATRDGRARMRAYLSEDALRPGDALILDGRYWLVEDVGQAQDEAPPQVVAKPARYRLRLRYPDGRESVGAFRRFRPDRPKLGHAFTTVEEGAPVSWQVVDETLAHDEQGEPYLDLVAERDYGEYDQLPDHELEHALEAQDEGLPAAAGAALARAEQAGLSIELVALEAGEAPDWAEAERYIDALILAEIEDDLLEQCGVNPSRDPRGTWLDAVKHRLRTDLERWRDDVEGDHDQIEEWEFRGGRIFASVGSLDDESNPDHGHGWMCRLVDSGSLGVAGFQRVRKAELL